MKPVLVRIISRRFVAGLLVDENYRVVSSAPILRSLRGLTWQSAWSAIQENGWYMEIIG